MTEEEIYWKKVFESHLKYEILFLKLCDLTIRLPISNDSMLLTEVKKRIEALEGLLSEIPPDSAEGSELARLMETFAKKAQLN